MHIFKLLFLLPLAVLGLTNGAETPVRSVEVGQQRMGQVYAHLKNAEQMLANGIVLDDADLQQAARRMTPDALLTECTASATRCHALLASAPAQRRAEIFAYMKNACLRLTDNREEPMNGHLDYGRKHPTKAISEARVFADRILKTLKSL